MPIVSRAGVLIINAVLRCTYSEDASSSTSGGHSLRESRIPTESSTSYSRDRYTYTYMYIYKMYRYMQKQMHTLITNLAWGV